MIKHKTNIFYIIFLYKMKEKPLKFMFLTILGSILYLRWILKIKNP